MAIPADALLRLTGRPSAAGGGAGPLRTAPPGYEILDRIGQLNIQPPSGGGIIPQRYQEGGVAYGEEDDEDDNNNYHPWPPPLYQGGGVAYGGGYPDYPELRAPRMTPVQQRLAYLQAMQAMRGPAPTYRMQQRDYMYPIDQTQRPIYTGEMLTRPPSKLSGYYGELGYQKGGVARAFEEEHGPPRRPDPREEERNYWEDLGLDLDERMKARRFPPVPGPQFNPKSANPRYGQGYYRLMAQEGGVAPEAGEVDPETGRVKRNYATEGAGQYYYVDPNARESAAGYAATPQRPYDPMVASGLVHTGDNILDWDQPNVGGRTYPSAGIVRDYQQFSDSDIPAILSFLQGPRAEDFYPPASPYVEPTPIPYAPRIDRETGKETFSLQEGGVVYPEAGMDATGSPAVKRTRAPRQQASAVAGEPSKNQKAQAQPRQRYEFGPADFFYNAPGVKRLMEMAVRGKGLA